MPYFFLKLEKMSQNLSSAAVVIGALRVVSILEIILIYCAQLLKNLKKIIPFKEERYVYQKKKKKKD